ncbi:uncharacterized protein LOC119611586, partial [Lucilia sericata]|uniref:uncharacterized protein LOC119611586 n=1 Tax=Lucilia sericata TaxID=13632 RepID=UPI0018A82019
MEQLRKKRTQLKKSVIKLYNFISGHNVSYNDIKVRMEEFENVFMKYKDIQDEIDSLCDKDSDIQKEDAYRNEIDEMYFTAKSIYTSYTQENLDSTVIEGAAASTPQLNNDLTALLQTMSTTLTSVVNLQSSGMNNSNINNNNSSIRLPQIEIPDFDGNLSNWIRFRDLFNAMVDARTNLSDVEKLEYLQTKLKGEASSIIKHLTPTNGNYRIAWDIVKKKYDRPDQIKETYIRLLLTQPSVKNGTLSEIRKFYNNTIECYNALSVLYESVASWDPLLLFLIKEKLDRETITLWYRQQNDIDRQSFKKLLDFLESRVIELESLEIPDQSSKFRKPNKFVTMTATTQSCPVCQKDHFLFACQQFKDLNIERRKNVVLKSGFCLNCLKEKHFSKDCKSSSCRTCGLKHNTLLHVNTNPSRGNAEQSSDDTNGSSSITVNSSQQTTTNQTTLLPTAVIMVRDRNNSLQPCRALVDTGAQSTLISESCVQRLQLNRSHDKTALCGVGGNTTSYTRGKVQLEIFAKDINRTIIVQTYCLSNLTQYIPSHTIVNQKLEYFKDLKLADPVYHKPNHIDIILGADVFPHCILGEKVSHPSGSPTALSTIFGWVIMGNVNRQPEKSIMIAHLHTGLDEQLQRFWEIEQCDVQSKHLTPDEEHAEQHFKENVRKQPDGRYMVKLPFKANSFQLGESKTAAMRRLESMERQFDKNGNLKVEFHKFMNEYIELNHMEIATNKTEHQVYYMPHHAVLKPSSTTTKLRVVFDAFCKSSNNTSLNDHLLVGPTVQNDLYSILLNFRKHKIGFTADIEKMYRQVLIHPDDISYQSILWRDSPKDPPITYHLRTVTHGTASAPFLATRTLMQVALDNSQKYPEESNEIINKFYVDDYMSSAPDLESAISRHRTLCTVLSKSGFNLRKWSTNSRELLDKIDPQDRACSSELIIDQSETVKTLALLWNTSTDCFQYSVCFGEITGIITKRRVLSDISRIYDPIGWLSPVLIKMKIFMQKLWIKGVNWDEDLPSDLKAEWLQLQHQVENIRDLQIPRWFNFNVEDRIELHGFADSSELAYSTAIYIRVIKPDGSITTSLITSKTRVTPIRQITLPRLELCAAHLMVKVMVKVKQALELQNVPTYGWTDSTVVLAWLSDHPRRWKTFIANRTSHIINIIPASQWRHITSKQNPADLATRGISSSEIKDNSLWWQGPHVLQGFTMEASTMSTASIPSNIDLEERKVIATATSVKQTDLFHLFSSYDKLLRVTALILRFFGNCKCKSQRQTGFLTTTELQNAHRMLVRKAQHETYAAEI